MKTFNEKQEALLKHNKFQVMKEVNFIRDVSSDKPMFNIYYDEHEMKFGLQVFNVIIQDPKALKKYSNMLNKRIDLIKQLNSLGDE